MPNYKRGLVVASVPLIFGIGFAQLASLFDYPDVLRKPTEEVLTKFAQQQSAIAPWWWAMFVAALAFVPASVLVVRWSGLTGSQKSAAKAIGVAGGLVQALGLSRWLFAVPVLAEAAKDPSQAKTAILLFDLIHRWFGMGIGEWAGYFFTALWTALVAFGLISKSRWLGVTGLLISIGIGAGLTEVFGFAPAGAINAIAYSLWVIWMLALAVQLSLNSTASNPELKP